MRTIDLRNTRKVPFAELRRFCGGVRSDWDAVLASLKLPWSNGPTEGHVNRLKLIKRQISLKTLEAGEPQPSGRVRMIAHGQ